MAIPGSVPLLENLPPPEPGYVLSEYVLDFGNVVKGSTKKRTFRLKNAGWQPINLDIDKNALLSAGFRVDPDKVVKLPGLPEPEAVDFTITFTSGKVRLGHMKHMLRLDVRPGPPMAVLLKANVTVPELHLPTTSIDFGNVVSSRAKTFTVLLTNPSAVVAEWSVKRPIEQVKDFDFFACAPDAGTLPPKGKVQVEVTFTPKAERAYGVNLVFKANNNPKGLNLAVAGAGKELKVQVTPDSLDMAPVLPYGPPSEAYFSLHNPTDYEIEVYAVDVDEQS